MARYHAESRGMVQEFPIMPRNAFDAQCKGRDILFYNAGRHAMRITELTEKTDQDGYVQIRVATCLPKQEVDLIIVVQPAQPVTSGGNPYDFSGLSGRLTWQGDALREQKVLRSEW